MKNKSNILIVIRSIDKRYGGAATGLISLTQAFVNIRNLKTTLLSCKNGLDEEYIDYVNNELSPARKIFIEENYLRLPTLRSYKILIKQIIKNEFIYIHSINSPLSIITFFLSKILLKKIIFRPTGAFIEVYTLSLTRKRHLSNFIQLFIYRFSNAIIVSSEYEYNSLLKYSRNLLPKKIIHIINESLPKSFNNNLNFSSVFPQKRDVDILYVGRINSNKGILKFLKQFIDHCKKYKNKIKHHNFKIVLCGPIDESSREFLNSEILKTKNKLDFLDIKYMGLVSDAVRDQLYQTSKYYIYPTQGDCFGLGPLEAAYNGCRLLSTKKLGIHLILKKLDILEYIDSEEFSFFKLISEISIYDSNLDVNQLRQNLNSSFSFENYISSYSNLIKRII